MCGVPGNRPPSFSGCKDSAITFTFTSYTAYALLQWCNYATDYPDASLRGKAVIYGQSNYTAPGETVINVWGVPQARAAGVDVSAKCNNLHLNLSRPFLPFFHRTNTITGHSGFVP